MLNRLEYVTILFVILSFVLICLHLWPCQLGLAVLVPQFVERIRKIVPCELLLLR